MSLFYLKKKGVSLIAALTLLFSLVPTAWASSQPTVEEFQSHWAQANLQKWVDEGLLQGDHGFYYPDRPITRAELMSLINRSFEFTEAAEIAFSDVESSNWAYEQIAIAEKAGYVRGYDDHTIRPEQAVTREECARMVATLLELEASGEDESEPFKDENFISSWSLGAVHTLARAGIIVGDPNGNFNPKAQLTRAEAVTLLERALEYTNQPVMYDKAGVYGPVTGLERVTGDVIVSAPGVTLQNMVIEGNLTLTEGVGEGDAFFKKVTVKGTTTIEGGGTNSVHFEDSVLVRVSIDKRSGTVRVVVVGKSSIQSVIVHSSVKLEESSVTDSGFANVELATNLPQGSQVQLIGQFEDVSILSSDIKISIPSGSVETFNVDNGAKNAEITVDENATIMNLILNAVANLLGDGKVTNAIVHSEAAGSTFQTPPESVDGEAASTVTTTGGKGGGNPIGGGGGGGQSNNSAGGGNNSGHQGDNDNPGNNGSDGDSNHSGNNGEDDHGDNPGDDNHAVACTGTVDECRDARLVDLTVSGFALHQVIIYPYVTGGMGFNPEVFEYAVVTDREMADPVTAAITVVKSVYSSVSYDVRSTGFDQIQRGSISENQNTFEFEMHKMKDYRITIHVNSGDGIGTKEYRITFQYPRSIQEGLKLARTSNGFINGEWVADAAFTLEKGSVNGEGFLYTDNVIVSESASSAPFLTCTYSCTIPDTAISAPEGVWYVKVLRDGITLAEGEYHYDLSIPPVLTADIGLEAHPLTKQELIGDYVQGPNSAPSVKGYTVYADIGKLHAAFPTAKYINIGTRTMSGTVHSYPEGLTKEEFKVGVIPLGYSGPDMANATMISFYTPGMRLIYSAIYFQTNLDEEYRSIQDEFLFMGLYDENLELLGQYITVVQYDQDHIADGYTAAGNWNPID